MLDIIFTIGIPGSGKSSWVKEYVAMCKNYYVVCPDKIRASLGDMSDQSLNSTAWLIARERASTTLSLGHNVIVDATNVNTHFRRKFVKELQSDSEFPFFNRLCSLKAKLFDLDPDTAFSRIRVDIANKRDRSNVPEEVVYKMYGEYLYTKKVIASEGFTLI